jgi:hypothetical protein
LTTAYCCGLLLCFCRRQVRKDVRLNFGEECYTDEEIQAMADWISRDRAPAATPYRNVDARRNG